MNKGYSNTYRDYRYSDVRNQTYIYGNTVRQAAPAYEPERVPQRRPQRTPEQERQLRQRQNAAKRNQKRTMIMNGRYVLFLSAATLICAVFCGLFVMMQAEVTANMKHIASLETQISSLKIQNDMTEKRLDTAINLEEIKEQALSLGMAYPTEEQLVTYSVDYADYMNQYASIP